MDDLKDQLQDEVNEKQKLQDKNRQLNSEVGTVQNLESSLDMLERNKDRLESEFVVYKVATSNIWNLYFLQILFFMIIMIQK